MDQEELKSSHDENQSKDFQKEVKSLVDVNEIEDGQYKSLLIVNETKDAKLTLYLYPTWFQLVSKTSKIIEPSKRLLHREETRFQFELVASFEDKRKKRTILGPVEWVKDTCIKVTEPLTLTQEDLANYPEEKRICLRKQHREKELRESSGKINLYAVLGLDMTKERKKKNIDEQKKAIKKAFREKMKTWHPDKNFGDHEIAMEIIKAKKILLDDETRARYHNEADYDKGWLSTARFRAIFWPECFTEEQKKAFRRRIGLLILSLGLTAGGVALSVLTAAAAAPVVVICGAIFGGGLAGGGIQSSMYTIGKDSVLDECDFSKWLLKAGIGFVGGAITGGAAVGITEAVVGIGSAALETGAATAAQFVGISTGSGAVGSGVASLASDAARKFVDKEDLSKKQIFFHAASAAVIGATAGALGGLALHSVVDRQASAATANLKGEVGEQVVIVTGARRLGNTLERNISRKLTKAGTEAIMGTASQFAEERFDDSVENQHPMEHIVRGVKNLAISGCAKRGAGTPASHAFKVVAKVKSPKENTVGNEQGIRPQARNDLSIENNEDRVNWRSSKRDAGCEPIEPSKKIYPSKNAISEEPGTVEEPQEGTIMYISKGAWFSKLIVTYCLQSGNVCKEVSGSWEMIKIPAGATQIEVRFQVCRLLWGDIIKYDRFKKVWCKPYEPHVFRYKKPPVRTFTISGPLGWEAVMRVSNEYHEETGEMS